MGKNSLMDHIIMSELMKTEMAMTSFSKEHIIETLEHIIETIKKIDEEDSLALASAGQSMSSTGNMIAIAGVKKYRNKIIREGVKIMNINNIENNIDEFISMNNLLDLMMAEQNFNKKDIIEILENMAQTINDIEDNDYATLGIAGTAMIDIGQLLATVAIKKISGDKQ